MEYLAEKSFSFLQYFAFTSINIETCTNKWNTSPKKSFSFLQDFAFISINIERRTNKWNISRKSRFLFCKILHLLVLKMKHVLINGISREKVVFFFARFCIY